MSVGQALRIAFGIAVDIRRFTKFPDLVGNPVHGIKHHLQGAGKSGIVKIAVVKNGIIPLRRGHDGVLVRDTVLVVHPGEIIVFPTETPYDISRRAVDLRDLAEMPARCEDVSVQIEIQGVHVDIIDEFFVQSFVNRILDLEVIPAAPDEHGVAIRVQFDDMVAHHLRALMTARHAMTHINDAGILDDEPGMSVRQGDEFMIIHRITRRCPVLVNHRVCRIPGDDFAPLVIPGHDCQAVVGLDLEVHLIFSIRPVPDGITLVIQNQGVRISRPCIPEDQTGSRIVINRDDGSG